MNIDYSMLPDYMQTPIQLYIEEGVRPGSFLTAVLSNDLMGALRQADDVNVTRLRDYGMFLHNMAPAACFGSPGHVDRWIRSGGLKGRQSVGTSAEAETRI